MVPNHSVLVAHSEPSLRAPLARSDSFESPFLFLCSSSAIKLIGVVGKKKKTSFHILVWPKDVSKTCVTVPKIPQDDRPGEAQQEFCGCSQKVLLYLHNIKIFHQTSY